jgi:hypothetical protein
MGTFRDYETWGHASVMSEKPMLLERYRGTSVVGWYGSIEGQLERMEDRYRSAHNDEYADRLHTFLLTWRSHPITGSMNIDTLELLESASAQLAADPWQLRDYFRNLRDQLRKLIASFEELPAPGEEEVVRRRLKPTEGPGSVEGSMSVANANAEPPADQPAATSAPTRP